MRVVTSLMLTVPSPSTSPDCPVGTGSPTDAKVADLTAPQLTTLAFKKVKQLARKSALSLRAKQNELIVLDALTFEAPKTKAMVEVLNNLKVAGKKVLFVTAENDLNTIKSAANIQKTNVVTANELNTYTIMNSNVVVLTEASAAAIEATFKA